MSADQVIKAGESISAVTQGGHFALIGFAAMLFGAFMVIGCIAIRSEGGCWLSILTIVCGFGAVLIGASGTEDESAIEKWKVSYVTPYIQSLPEQKTDIIYVKIDPQFTDDDANTKTIGEAERTAFIIGYKNDSAMQTQKGMMETSFTLSDDEKPYITYKTIPVTLGNGVEAGIYNVKIYLPENYTFTDVK